MSAKNLALVPPRSRRQQKAATRAKLLQAAQRCFADRGYVETQIKDIAQAAGVAHGTFYVHFANKEALLQELLTSFNVGLVARLIKLRGAPRVGADRGSRAARHDGSDGHSGRDGPTGRVAGSEPVNGPGAAADAVAELGPRVRPMARSFLRYWSDHRAFVHAVAQKTALGTSIESLRDGINPEMVQFLTRTLQETARTGGLALDNVDLITHGLLALWMRIGMQALFNETVSLRRAEDALVTMTVGALQQAAADSAAVDPNDEPGSPS